MDPFPCKDYIKAREYISLQFMHGCKFKIFSSAFVLWLPFILTVPQGRNPAHMGADVHMGRLVQGALGPH